jgi:hypothetical protein
MRAEFDWKIHNWEDCVGPGWRQLCLTLKQACVEHDVMIMQVKEKFGALRFYVDEAETELYDLIDAAEKASETTCETCGEPGKIVTTGWFKATCGKHT